MGGMGMRNHGFFYLFVLSLNICGYMMNDLIEEILSAINYLIESTCKFRNSNSLYLIKYSFNLSFLKYIVTYCITASEKKMPQAL